MAGVEPPAPEPRAEAGPEPCAAASRAGEPRWQSWHLPDPQVLQVGGTGTKNWGYPALLFLWFLGLHMVCAPVLHTVQTRIF